MGLDFAAGSGDRAAVSDRGVLNGQTLCRGMAVSGGAFLFPLLAHELFVLLEKNGTQKPMEKFGRDAYESDRDHESAA